MVWRVAIVCTLLEEGSVRIASDTLLSFNPQRSASLTPATTAYSRGRRISWWAEISSVMKSAPLNIAASQVLPAQTLRTQINLLCIQNLWICIHEYICNDNRAYFFSQRCCEVHLVRFDGAESHAGRAQAEEIGRPCGGSPCGFFCSKKNTPLTENVFC